MGLSMHRRVVPETYVQLLYDYLEARGHVPESVLGQPWPEPDLDGAGGVDVELWGRMLDVAADRLLDPLLGLHLGQTITARHLGVLGSVLVASVNLGEALQRLNRYLRLVFDVLPMVVRDGQGWLEIAWDDREYEPEWRVNETGCTVLVHFCRTLVRGTINPLLVSFKHTVSDTRPYEEFFGCPLLFGQSEAFVRFSIELLSLPLKSPDPALAALLEQHADRLLARLPQQPVIVEQVRKALARTLRESGPDIERISEQLCCSSRTLQRRLREAGTSFRDELNLVRYELAQSYLKDPRLQIVDIALLLGYSEHSAFTRAFKEWSGKSPQEIRAA